MARHPARRPARKSASKPVRNSAAANAATPAGARDKIIAAFLALLAERRIEQTGFAEIADGAGVTLAQMRGEFSSVLAILAAYLKSVDRAVLAEDMADMAEEPPRERLFDVLMRRLEVMAPHREAVRSLVRSASRNPPLALALNGLAVRSQQWMLTAAGIQASGPRGMMRAQGLAVLFGSVLRTWVNDDDPGLARTMAALDRALGRGQRFAGLLDELCRVPSRLCRLRSRFRRRGEDAEESAAA
jgi:AcrR family transcriptional regulator